MSKALGILAALVFGSIASAALSTAACSKSESESRPVGATQPRPLPSSEINFGRQACEKFAERVCACAKANAQTHPEMANQCKLAKARPEAFAQQVEMSKGRGLTKRDYKAANASARQLAAKCIEAEAQLDSQLCPRL